MAASGVKFLWGGAFFWIRYVTQQVKAIPGAFGQSQVDETRLNAWGERCNNGDNKRSHVVSEFVPLPCGRRLSHSCLHPHRPWWRPEPCVRAEVGPVDTSSDVSGCWRMSRTGVAVLWVFVVTNASLYITLRNIWATLMSLYVFLPLARLS